MSGTIKIVFVQTVVLFFQGISYFLVQKIDRATHNVIRKADQKIPYISQTVFIYVLWYPLIAFVPVYFYSVSETDYFIYLAGIISDIIISLIIYTAYPTTFERPMPSEDKLSGKLLAWIYKKGNYKGKNCMPSMHCSMCFLIIMTAVSCDGIIFVVKVGIAAVAILIMASTVTTKQHMIVDVISGILLAVLCFIIGNVLINMIV